MRSILLTTITWILIACGAFLMVRGGLDYWESKSAQRAIASEWNGAQSVSVSPTQTQEQDASARTVSPQNTDAIAGVAPARSENAAIALRQGTAMARLSIPRLHTILYVVEGDDDRDLKRAPGHLIGTAMPGEEGNCVIAGHRDTHFRVLKDIRKGDEIILQRHGKNFHYIVDEMSIISPDNSSPLRPAHAAVLNLITCYPFNYVGAAPKRFIVHARLEDEPLRASR